MSIKLRALGRRHFLSQKVGLISLLIALGPFANAQQQPSGTPSPVSTPLLVGYLPAFKGVALADSVQNLDLTRMTHLNLAFGDPPKCNGVCTPQSDMTFSLADHSAADIDAAIAAAHAKGIKVLLSIGGGGGDQLIIQFYNAGLSAPLIASLDQFVRLHKLDGVDLDIEDPSAMGAPLGTFTSALISTFHPEGRIVTAAVAKYLQDSMPDSALHQFDFINVMNYSSYASAVTAMQFYAQNKKIPRNKIVLGVPFFASNIEDTKEEDYAKILASYPNAWKVDMVGGGSLDDGQEFHYVGETTMTRETQLGKEYGGVMIWEMMGDAPSPHSLLKIIEKGLATPSPASTGCACHEVSGATEH